MIGNVNTWHAGYLIYDPIKGSFDPKGVTIRRLRTTLLDDNNTLMLSACPGDGQEKVLLSCCSDIRSVWKGHALSRSGGLPEWREAQVAGLQLPHTQRSPWPTSSLNSHKLLFCLKSHMDAQVSEGCACYFRQTPPMMASFENIPELVRPRKTYGGIKQMFPSLTSAPSSVTLWMASHQTPWLWRQPRRKDSVRSKFRPSMLRLCFILISNCPYPWWKSQTFWKSWDLVFFVLSFL